VGFKIAFRKFANYIGTKKQLPQIIFSDIYATNLYSPLLWVNLYQN
jgi:hypothetical protein